jgi:hypothetical protein
MRTITTTRKTDGLLKTALCAAGNVYKNVWPFLLIGVLCSSLCPYSYPKR